MTEVLSLEAVGKVTIMACPTCNAPLYEVADHRTSRFYCAEGHGFSLDEVCPEIEESVSGFLSEAFRLIAKNKGI